MKGWEFINKKADKLGLNIVAENCDEVLGFMLDNGKDGCDLVEYLEISDDGIEKICGKHISCLKCLIDLLEMEVGE